MNGKKPSVAFIGTGIMGGPIAGHILDAGYPLTVYNRTKEKADGLVARGAVWADSAAKAAADADVVFTMVGFPTDVEDIYLSTNGLLRAAKKGAYLIDLTTSSPALAKDIAQAAEVEGLHAFDCPVTGGDPGAKAGTLTLICGATEKKVEPVRALLETFSSSIRLFDEPGQGQAAKLCNQVALAGSMIGMADALAFAGQCGLDREQVIDLVQHGTGQSGAMGQLGPRAAAGDWKPGFIVEHFIKDLGLALEIAEDKQLTLPGADTAFTLYDMLDVIGGGRLGTQAVELLYEEEADAAAAGLDWAKYKAVADDQGSAGAAADGAAGGAGRKA